MTVFFLRRAVEEGRVESDGGVANWVLEHLSTQPENYGQGIIPGPSLPCFVLDVLLEAPQLDDIPAGPTLINSR